MLVLIHVQDVQWQLSLTLLSAMTGLDDCDTSAYFAALAAKGLLRKAELVTQHDSETHVVAELRWPLSVVGRRAGKWILGPRL